jgi:hypothetical protein
MFDIPQAVQVAHYWKYKQPLDFHIAVKVGNDIVSRSAFPNYVEEWLDFVSGGIDEKTLAPVVRFLLNLLADHRRGR